MMDLVVVIATLVLTAVFVVAGGAKLADLPGSRRAMQEFGLPSNWAPLLGLILPLGELAVAGSLLIRPQWGGAGAMGLLTLFIIGISAALVRGKRPDCHCFGQLSSTPAGGATLVRNGLLLGIATFVTGAGGTTPVALLQSPALPVALGLLACGLVAGLIGVIRGRRLSPEPGQAAPPDVHTLSPLETASLPKGTAPLPQGIGLPVGSPAPGFALLDLGGDITALSDLRAAGQPVLLIFSNPPCEACTALLPEIAQWQQAYDPHLTIALVSRGRPAANTEKIGNLAITHVLIQRNREVANAYDVNRTPSAVLVRADGTVGSPVAGGPDAIRALLGTALGQAAAGSVPASATAVRRAVTVSDTA